LYSPSTLEAKGIATRSFTGKHQYLRRAITGPGLLPLKIPTTPVFCDPVCTSIPKLRKCAAIFSAVLNSIS
jgi:hypothetical protein